MSADAGAPVAVADLDYRAAERGVGPLARLRAVAANPLSVIGGTVALLLTVVPGSVLVVLLVAAVLGGAWSIGVEGVEILFFLTLLTGCGAYTVYDVLRKSGGGGALEAFAKANGLRHLSGDLGTHYAGRRFVDSSHLVHTGVRTRSEPVLEVGDLFPITPVSSTRPDGRKPTAYVRVVATGFLPTGPDAAASVVDPGLRAELEALLGEVGVEVAGREVTVYGARSLEPARKGRLREVMLLAERVALAAEDVATRTDAAPVERSAAGITIPAVPTKAPTPGRRIHPALLVLGTLVGLIVLPVGFAVVLSALEPYLRGRDLLIAVVLPLLVAVMVAVVGVVIRLAVTFRRR